MYFDNTFIRETFVFSKKVCNEVKAGENLQAKSFAFFCQKYQPEYACKISALPFNQTNNVFNYPLYGFMFGIGKIDNHHPQKRKV